MNVLLSNQQFRALSSFIYRELGIKMPEKKLTMLSSRLNKRIRALNMDSFDNYSRYLFSAEGMAAEMIHLINAVTTNKTEFFREPKHFEYLIASVLPDLLEKPRISPRANLNIWSAGCSTGEEAYTLAMVLSEFGQNEAGFDFSILATDISTRVLEIARRAVYPLDRIGPISNPLRKKYLLRRRDRNIPEVRIVPALRQKITFGRLNFMDDDFGLSEMMDVIFCRNVIIYFDAETQEKLMHKFCRHLKSGGFLFLGHSESLHSYELPLRQVAPTIYQKP